MEGKEAALATIREEVDEDKLDYATLAKLGGRKDLLVHHEHTVVPNAKPQSYPWVEWFDHTPSPAQPAKDEGSASRVKSSFLTWTVADESLSPSNALRARHRRLTYPPQAGRTKKTSPKLPSLTSEPPLDFHKLLSMEYQKEWVDSNRRRVKAAIIKQQEKKEIQKQKLSLHSKARKLNVEEAEKKPRFIMKRFLNVPAKLKLPPL